MLDLFLSWHHVKSIETPEVIGDRAEHLCGYGDEIKYLWSIHFLLRATHCVVTVKFVLQCRSMSSWRGMAWSVNEISIFFMPRVSNGSRMSHATSPHAGKPPHSSSTPSTHNLERPLDFCPMRVLQKGVRSHEPAPRECRGVLYSRKEASWRERGINVRGSLAWNAVFSVVEDIAGKLQGWGYFFPDSRNAVLKIIIRTTTEMQDWKGG